jgi:hypothetical protein
MRSEIEFLADQLVREFTLTILFSTFARATGCVTFTAGARAEFATAVADALARSNSQAALADLRWYSLGSHAVQWFLIDPTQVKPV